MTEPGVLATAPTPVTEMLDATAARFGDRVAIVHDAERITWAELRERVDRMAGGLAARGIGVGDPVALVLPNMPAFALVFLAVLRAGATVVPLNPAFKEAELEFHFRECGVRAIVAGPQELAMCAGIAAGLPGPVEVLAAGDAAGDAVSLDSLLEGDAAAPAAASADDDAVFQYSSGSTGRPKRVPRTHRHLRAEADSVVAATGMTADDTVFCVIPLHHTYGMGCCLLACVRSGAKLVLFHDAHPFVLQRGRALTMLEEEQATVFPAVPFTFRLLAEAAEQPDLSALRLCYSAAAALPRSTFEAFDRRFGIAVRQLYGCTEAGAVTVNDDPDPRGTGGSVGRPIDGVEVRVTGPGGELLEHGRVGEIQIRSAAMTPGYAGLEELNRVAFRDGWFATGDRGRLDEDGRLFITGREKLLIDVRGEKVDPIEVEDVLAVHPKVDEVVVVGVTGDVEGEQLVKAVVVPAGDCGERELIRYCRERLADYKVPQRVEFMDEIPVSSAGKVLRKYLI
jgi:long-chain acyl-CoA synthetase